MRKVDRQGCLVAAILIFIAGFIVPSGAAAGPEEDLRSGIDAFNRGDLIAAMDHYRIAADAGLAEAQVRLAYILDYSEENDEAFRLYSAAAEQGNADGYYGLGEMTAKGEGTDQDFGQAVEFFVVAAENGNLRAIRLLARAYGDGELGVKTDPVLAGKWLIRAAEMGDRMSMQQLIAAYESGTHGLEPNSERARYWNERLKSEFPDND
jgi:TPR repeat protein